MGCDGAHRAENHRRPISIHAPQWGATSAVGSSHCSRSYFNPRTPVGCDDGLATDLDARLGISIHAPQWGATSNTTTSSSTFWYFNPRTPVGCDSTTNKTNHQYRPFQSTHPSGVRLVNDWLTMVGSTYFNPRTPVGCDGQIIDLHVFKTGFQSTHPSGVRRNRVWYAGYINRISIHAPQWGATARMGIAFHNMEAPPVLKTDFIAKIHVHRSIHKFSNQKHQQTIHF